MCFSAGASFTSGVLLTVVGTETLRKVHKPSQLAFAGITLFFAFQQFIEGFLWTIIPHQNYPALQKTATYIFMLMAQVAWPVLIPLSVLLMEESKTRKRILFALLAVGLGVGLYFLRRALAYEIHAVISGYHVIYQSAVPDPSRKIPMFFYLVATLVPFFVSSLKRAYIMGIIMTVSFIVSAVFYRQYLTSVWCFFAAVMSFVIFYIIRDSHKKTVL
jgi:hypothetical protein